MLWTQKARGYSGKVLESRLPKIDVNVILNSEVATNKRLAISQFKFIPLGTIVEPKRIIAGFGSDKNLHVAATYAKEYKVDVVRWSKLVGVINSSQYLFDIHWYYHPDVGYTLFKIKSRKDK